MTLISQMFRAAMAKMPLQCLFGMYGTELLFHRHFLDLTQDCGEVKPEEADLLVD